MIEQLSIDFLATNLVALIIVIIFFLYRANPLTVIVHWLFKNEQPLSNMIISFFVLVAFIYGYWLVCTFAIDYLFLYFNFETFALTYLGYDGKDSLFASTDFTAIQKENMFSVSPYTFENIYREAVFVKSDIVDGSTLRASSFNAFNFFAYTWPAIALLPVVFGFIQDFLMPAYEERDEKVKYPMPFRLYANPDFNPLNNQFFLLMLKSLIPLALFYEKILRHP